MSRYASTTEKGRSWCCAATAMSEIQGIDVDGDGDDKIADAPSDVRSNLSLVDGLMQPAERITEFGRLKQDKQMQPDMSY